VLDQSVIVGNEPQTVAMLAESARLDYKTVQKSLARLEKRGLVQKRPTNSTSRTISTTWSTSLESYNS